MAAGGRLGRGRVPGGGEVQEERDEPLTAAAEGQVGRVAFYEDVDGLLSSVVPVLVEVLRRGGVVVVLPTAAHATAVAAALQQAGLPMQELEAAGRYVVLDAGEVLTSASEHGTPDPTRFLSVVGGVIADAGRDGRRVHVFSEMVAVAWESGDVRAAIELERLWAHLLRTHRFTLSCGYPVTGMSVVPDGGGSPDERSRTFVPVPRAARAVRRFVGETLRAWDLGDVVDEAELVASELVTNALGHADRPFRFSLRRSEDGVRISLSDADPTGHGRRPPAPETTEGFRLAVVVRLAQRWGIDEVAGGKVVWAELASSHDAAEGRAGGSGRPPTRRSER